MHILSRHVSSRLAMVQQRTPGLRMRRVFLVTASATLLAAFVQVTLGGIVRVTGSGLGCPDWPLCHGQLIPPFEFATLIEYTHRLSASLLSVLIIVTTFLAWLYYRSDARIFGAALIGLVMVVAAAILGGITVLTELKWWIRLFHLGIAQTVVAAMVVAIAFGWMHSRRGGQARLSFQSGTSLRYLAAASTVGVFLLVLSGSYMVGYGAGSSCATWPLCRGSLFPEGSAYAVHMGHRYLAFLVGVLVLATAMSAWSRRRGSPALGWAGLSLAALFLAQALVGAGTVWAGFSPEWKALHLSVATLVWIALVLLAALAYAGPSGVTAPQERAAIVSELGRMTP